MKTKILKTSSVLVLFAMLLVIFAGCGGNGGNQEITTTEPTTEAKPQALVLNSITYQWMGSTKTLTVGQQLELDEYGRIKTFKDGGDVISFQYDDAGNLIRIETAYEEGKIGYENLTFVDGVFTERKYDANNGFRSLQDAKITVEKDSTGRIVKWIEDVKYTDVDDGSIDYKELRYECFYDDNGLLNSVDYYSADKKDHTSNMTYDEKGNLIVFSNVGADGGNEYLRFEFEYTMVDADTVKVQETDNFTAMFNWEYMLNHII